MQGLPTHQLSKAVPGSMKTQGNAEGKVAINADAQANVEGAKTEGVKGDFSSLFASMTGTDAQKSTKKPSGVKSETGETLKNLLAEKKSDKEGEGKTEGKVAVDPKLTSELLAKPALVKSSAQTSPKLEQTTEQKIAKTSNNLDQLLNSLKGTQDLDETQVEGSEKNNSLQHLRSKKDESLKGELKSETPLEFLMKGAKNKGVTENTTPDAHLGQKVMTAEDYLKNMQSAEKKPVLTVINGRAELEQNNLPNKMMNLNAKNYGQGLNLINDPLIRNTTDLASKDSKKIKSNDLSVDELRTKDTKVGAELASIRQEAIPAVQNNKGNHGQAEMQTNENQKVLDLSNIHTSNTNEIIKKISDYVEQNQVANKQSLDLTVKHDSLGEFKIQVSKMPESMNRGQNLIDMQITTSSKEGHDFFVKNEVSLMKNLNQAGINLSDLRVVSSMSESTPFGRSDSRQSSSFQQNSDGSKQFSSFESSSFAGNSSGSDEGSGRRKELWEEYQQRYGA